MWGAPCSRCLSRPLSAVVSVAAFVIVAPLLAGCGPDSSSSAAKADAAVPTAPTPKTQRPAASTSESAAAVVHAVPVDLLPDCGPARAPDEATFRQATGLSWPEAQVRPVGRRQGSRRVLVGTATTALVVPGAWPLVNVDSYGLRNDFGECPPSAPAGEDPATAAALVAQPVPSVAPGARYCPFIPSVRFHLGDVLVQVGVGGAGRADPAGRRRRLTALAHAAYERLPHPRRARRRSAHRRAGAYGAARRCEGSQPARVPPPGRRAGRGCARRAGAGGLQRKHEEKTCLWYGVYGGSGLRTVTVTCTSPVARCPGSLRRLRAPLPQRASVRRRAGRADRVPEEPSRNVRPSRCRLEREPARQRVASTTLAKLVNAALASS